jgi:zinc transporter, ZIP family
MSNVWIALGLTVFAGMATGIGSVLAFFAKRTDYRFLSISTGFSAGVMLYVSFIEIFFKGGEALVEAYGHTLGNWVNVGAFLGGMVIMGLIDNLIPAHENPHEVHSEEITATLRDPEAATYPPADDGHGHGRPPVPAPAGAAVATMGDTSKTGESSEAVQDDEDLLRTGLFTALAIGIHNFPEGLVTFLTALEDPALGAAIAIAVALHNIPEGISVSVPIYYATGDRMKAFLYSLVSGLAEPVGALIAYLMLRLFVGVNGGVFPPQIMGILFAGVAGVMVYISLDELLPTSRNYGKGHDSIIGVVAGMAVMAVSLLLLD